MDKQNKAYSNNNVKFEKPNVPRTNAPLIGHTGGSFNAGHNSPVHLEYVMAGQPIKSKVWQSKVKLLTPKTPSYQNLYLTQRTFFVPFSRVWDNYEEFTAQKGGASVNKITEMPNIAGKSLPYLFDRLGENDNQTLITNTLIYRDIVTSRYIPRLGAMTTATMDDADDGIAFNKITQKINVLPLRAFVAIYNDFLRSKEYDPERTEYKTDNVTQAEWNSYIPNDLYSKDDLIYLQWRAKMPDSYYTNYTTELQGQEVEMQFSDDPERALLYWTSNVEGITDYVRTQAQQANKNDWDIVAELRGTEPAVQRKVQLISKSTVPLAYSSVTQNAYNNNEQIQEQYRVLGQQGAFSYTELNLKLVEYFKPIEDGMLITIVNVWADNVFTSGIQRCDTNVMADERYRPDLIGQKVDVQYNYESGTNYTTQEEADSEATKILGFKRKFSELFTGRNMIYGDLLQNSYYKYQGSEEDGLYHLSCDLESKTIPNNTFTFYENNRFNYYEEDTGFYFVKKPWKDYSDLMLDKNQAVKEQKIAIENNNGILEDFVINGDNQIYYAGITITECTLPVDESIQNNYTTYGEH